MSDETQQTGTAGQAGADGGIATPVTGGGSPGGTVSVPSQPIVPVPLQQPTIGRIVHYVISDYDVEQVNGIPEARRSGNLVTVGQHLPAMITRVWSSTCVNLQVTLDGSDNLWRTSVVQNETPTPGQWHWPERS